MAAQSQRSLKFGLCTENWKKGFLADTNMDYLTSEWPGTPNFNVDANFDMFPQKYG